MPGMAKWTGSGQVAEENSKLEIWNPKVKEFHTWFPLRRALYIVLPQFVPIRFTHRPLHTTTNFPCNLATLKKNSEKSHGRSEEVAVVAGKLSSSIPCPQHVASDWGKLTEVQIRKGNVAHALHGHDVLSKNHGSAHSHTYAHKAILSTGGYQGYPREKPKGLARQLDGSQ